jgi:hypothetical protein
MSDSIFGDGTPQFAVNFGQTNQVVVVLDNYIITKDEPTVKKITNESELETDRVFTYLGEYWELDVQVNLFKYSNPVSKYNEIKQYKNQNVVLWKHGDGNYYKDTNGNPALFYIDEVTPMSLSQFDPSDILIIKFLSLKGVVLG